MQDLLLGLDIGTSSVKGLIIDQTGRILAQSETPNELISTHIGWAEQDVDRWKQNTIQLIRTCLDDPLVSSHNIRGIGVSGMVPALVLIDSHGQVLRPAIQYNDSRAVQEIQSYREKTGAFSFFYITGANPSVQSIGPKLAWIRHWEPQVWEKTAWIMGSYDYINYFLTGEISVERNWALESGLLDIHLQSWSNTLLSVFDLPETILPPVRSSLEITGKVSLQTAQITGLVPGTPVIAGSADHVAAALAAGITHPGDVLIKFGSSGDMLYCSDHTVFDPRFYIDFHCLPGKYLPNGCMATSGSLLKWFVNEFCQQDRIDAKRQDLDVYQYLDQQAEQIPPGSAGITVLPYFLGAKTPLNDPDARGVFYGMTLSHSRYHLYRAIMESVVYGFRDHFEVLQQLGLPIVRVVASEGGAGSPLWRQIAADVLDTPIEFLQANPGSAYGVAVMAGMALQIFDVEDLMQIQGAREISVPNPAAHWQYQSFYQTYHNLYNQLRPVFQSQ